MSQISGEICRLEGHAKDHDFKTIRDIRIKQGEQYSKAREFCKSNKVNWVEWLESPSNSPLGRSQVYKLLVLFRYRENLDDAFSWYGELNTVPVVLAPHKKKPGLTLDAVAAILVAHDRFKNGKLDLSATDAVTTPVQRTSVRVALAAERETSARLREELGRVVALYEAATGSTYQAASANDDVVASHDVPVNKQCRATTEATAGVGKYAWTDAMFAHFANVLGGAGNSDTLASGMEAAFGRTFSRLEVEWAKKRMRALARQDATQVDDAA